MSRFTTHDPIQPCAPVTSVRISSTRDNTVQPSMRIPRLVLAAGIAVAARAQTADLAVVNARIYTVNAKQPRASAMAVRQGVIIAIGDDVSHQTGPSTKVIDAHGAAIIPGLIDSHGHVEGLGT